MLYLSNYENNIGVEKMPKMQGREGGR